MAEAWLLRDDVNQASAVLGRPPDTLRERVPPGRLSALWRLHGRVAAVRGDQSRAIALFGRALRQAELALDSRAIGLAHYQLAVCYRQVGDPSIVREEIGKAISALNAAGDRRHLAQCHSLAAIVSAQTGRGDEALALLRQAEQLATVAQAEDVLALIVGNQAGVALMRYRHEQALALAERAVALQERSGSAHGLAVALATLAQVCVKLGLLTRAEDILHRALEVRSPVQFHETTGAVYDTLAQIHLIRGAYAKTEQCLQQASEAYGPFGQRASRWYEWSVRLLTARVALERGDVDGALRLAEAIAAGADAPPSESLQADLLVADALLAVERAEDADQRLLRVSGRIDPRSTPGSWGEYLRLRARLQVLRGNSADAYHDLSQSASVFDPARRTVPGRAEPTRARTSRRTGRRTIRRRPPPCARRAAVFESLGAERDLRRARTRSFTSLPANGDYLPTPGEGRRRDCQATGGRAAAMPDLLAIETRIGVQRSV